MKKYILYTFLIILILPFAFIGVDSYLLDSTHNGSNQRDIATVNHDKITANQLNSVVENYQNTLRQQGQLDGINPNTLRQQALTSLLASKVMEHFSSDIGLTISDESVAEFIYTLPVFQGAGGQFSRGNYTRFLRSRYQTASEFETDIRSQLSIEKLSKIINQMSVSNQFFDQYQARAFEQQRQLVYKIVEANTVIKVDKQTVRQFYNSNTDNFVQPPKTDIQYILLDKTDMQLNPSQQDLENFYQENKDFFDNYFAQKIRVKHILLSNLDTANQLRQQIEANPTLFDELASTHSIDAETANQGGKLGLIAKGVMTDAFDKIAFNLDVGVISNPITTEFGHHLVIIDDIQQARDFNLAKNINIVEQEYFARQMNEQLLAKRDQLESLSYEYSDSLEPIAQQLQLKLLGVKNISQLEDLPINLQNQELFNAMFSQELIDNLNSHVIELPNRQFVIFRQQNYQDYRQQSFDEVASTIESNLIAAKKLEEDYLHANLTANNLTMDNYDSVSGWQTSKLATLEALVEQNQLSEPLLQAVFARPVRAGQFFPAIYDNNSVALVGIIEVRTPEVADIANANLQDNSNSQVNSQIYLQFLQTVLLQQADISIHNQGHTNQ